MDPKPGRRPLFRRRWFRWLAATFLVAGILWVLTSVLAPEAVVTRFIQYFGRTDKDRDGKEISFDIRENCRFTGEGLRFRSNNRPPDRRIYLCIGKPRVIGPMLVELDFEWSGAGTYDAGGFTCTYLWTPWKSYLVGQKMHYIS